MPAVRREEMPSQGLEETVDGYGETTARFDLELARSGLMVPAGGIAGGRACRALSETTVECCTKYPRGVVRPRLGRWTQCRRDHSSRRRILCIVDSIREGSKAATDDQRSVAMLGALRLPSFRPIVLGRKRVLDGRSPTKPRRKKP